MTAAERKPDDDFNEVWVEFKKTGDQGLRNRLIERYFYLVKVIGNRIAARLPRSIDGQDRRSAGGCGHGPGGGHGQVGRPGPYRTGKFPHGRQR